MEHNLTYLRQQIDEIDSQIFDLFIKRIYLAKEIGLYKKQHNLPIFDTEREKNKREAISKMVPEEIQPSALKLLKTLMNAAKLAQEQNNG